MEKTIQKRAESRRPEERPEDCGATQKFCPSCHTRVRVDSTCCPSCSLPLPEASPAPRKMTEPLVGQRPETDEGTSELFPDLLADRYRILSLLGQGGMGAVYRALDTRLDREIALKLLIHSDRELASLFEQEARILANFEHDHIVRIYDFGLVDGIPYLTMEYVRGWSLATRLAERRPTLVEAVRIAIDILKGIAEAHGRGIVHRDLKPANVFIDETGRVKVADFGMAFRFASDGRETAGAKPDVIVGTPGYMAPEVRRGNPANPPADVYSVGVVLHEMLTGQRLYDVSDLSSYLLEPPSVPRAPSASNPSVPSILDAIVLRALDPDPGARPDARALTSLLSEWLEQSHNAARRPAAEGLPPHPYKFLSHYGKGDRAIFFGRDAEIEELVEILANSPIRLLFLFGPCGVGKSSLIQAGVLPALADNLFESVVLTSGGNPAETLLEEVAFRARSLGIPIAGHGTPIPQLLAASPRLLADALHEWGRSTGKTMILVLDQLEELFTHNSKGSPIVGEFFRVVEVVAGTRSIPAKLVLSFRTEFLGDLYPLEEKLQRYQRSVAVREIGEHGLIEVIEGPTRLAAYGFRYQDGFASHLTSEIIRNTSGASEAALPVLQIVCRQLYDAMKSSAGNTIGWSLYEETLGSVSEALGRYVEERLKHPVYAHRGAVARQMLKALTVKEGAERFARAGDEDDLLSFPDRVGAQRTLEQLIADHLVVRAETGDGARHVRLASEVICPLIDSWSVETGELDRAARTLSKAHRQWMEGGRRSEDLLVGSALSLVSEHLDALNGFSESEHRFVRASEARRKRRKTKGICVTAIVTTVMSFLFYTAYLQPGTVRIDSEPRQATVYWGDKLLGQTPLTWRASPGTYTFTLSRSPYDSARVDVRIPSGGVADYRPVLRYPFGILAVSSNPSNIECEVRSAAAPEARPLLARAAPFTTEVPVGSYVIKATRSGYVTTTTAPFSVGANRELSHRTITLSKNTGSLLVWTPILGCNVTVFKEGTTQRVWGGPLPMAGPQELPVGPYRVECVSDWGSRTVIHTAIRKDKTAGHSAWLDLPRSTWTATVNGPVLTSPALADLDGDGTSDAVFGLSDQNVCALSGKTGRSLWTYETKGRVHSSPAVGDLDGDKVADVVVGSNDRRVHAISGRSGRPVWTFQTGGSVVSSPALADLDHDGVIDVVVGSNDHHVYALSGRTGRPLWTYETKGKVRSSPVLFDLDGDGVADVVAGSDDKKVYAISGSKGQCLFTLETDGPIFSSPAVADIDLDGTAEIVVGSEDKSVRVIDGKTGRLEWTFATHGPVDSSPALCDFDGDGFLDIAIGSADRRVYAISGRTRAPLWTFSTRDQVLGSPVVADLNQDGIGDVVIGSNDQSTYVIDGRTGEQLFAFSAGSLIASAALSDLTGDGVPDIVLGSYLKPQVRAFSTVPQRARWVFGASGLIRNEPAVTDLDQDGFPDIVAATDSGQVVAVSGKTGRRLWSSSVGSLVSGAVAVVDLDRDGTFDAVVPALDGSVFALSGRNGRILWQSKLGPSARVNGQAEILDFDRDSIPDLLVGAWDGRIRVLSGRTGRELFSHQIAAEGCPFPGAADLDGDGREEFVATNSDGSVVAVSPRTRSRLWTFAASGEIRDFPVLADVDGDGTADVIFGSLDKNVYVLSGRTGRPLLVRHHGAQIWGTPTVSDLDGDGRPDIVVAAGNDEVVAYSGNSKPSTSRNMPGSSDPSRAGGPGETLEQARTVGGKSRTAPERPPLWTYSLHSEPMGATLSHIDGDGVPDFVVATTDGMVHMISGRTGQRIGLIHNPTTGTQFCPFVIDPAEPWAGRAVTWRTGRQGPPSTLNRPGSRRFGVVCSFYGSALVFSDVPWPLTPHGPRTPVGFTQGRSACSK